VIIRQLFRFYEKVLGIRETILPLHYPELIDSYNSIGALYDHMSDYSNALSFYQKAFDINERTVSLNDRSLASSYHNFGKTYYKMNCYDEALSCFEHAVTTGQRSLPSNHPDLLMYRNDLELVKDIVITVSL
jgi:tetratricopeptide (TPR) repeat protein